MKRIAVAAAAAAIISAAIPADAATCCPAGTSGKGGSTRTTINCAVSTKLNCRLPFWQVKN